MTAHMKNEEEKICETPASEETGGSLPKVLRCEHANFRRTGGAYTYPTGGCTRFLTALVQDDSEVEWIL